MESTSSSQLNCTQTNMNGNKLLRTLCYHTCHTSEMKRKTVLENKCRLDIIHNIYVHKLKSQQKPCKYFYHLYVDHKMKVHLEFKKN